MTLADVHEAAAGMAIATVVVFGCCVVAVIAAAWSDWRSR